MTTVASFTRLATLERAMEPSTSANRPATASGCAACCEPCCEPCCARWTAWALSSSRASGPVSPLLELALALADFSPTSRADEPLARELGAVDDGDESDADAEADEVAALRVAWSIGCAPSRAADALADGVEDGAEDGAEDAVEDAVTDAVTDAFAFDAGGALRPTAPTDAASKFCPNVPAADATCAAEEDALLRAGNLLLSALSPRLAAPSPPTPPTAPSEPFSARRSAPSAASSRAWPCAFCCALSCARASSDCSASWDAASARWSVRSSEMRSIAAASRAFA